MPFQRFLASKEKDEQKLFADYSERLTELHSNTEKQLSPKR